MTTDFWKYLAGKDLYLEHSNGYVLSRFRWGQKAAFYTNHINVSFVLTMVVTTITVVPLLVVSVFYHVTSLTIIAFILMALGFSICAHIATISETVRMLRDKKREEEIAHRDERLKKQVEKRDAKKHQEENALKQFVFPVINNNQPANMSVFLPSSVWKVLADFRAKFTAIDARAGFMPEKDLTNLDEVFVAVMDSVIWYDGLSEKLKELDSARTVEIYTALHRAISFLDEFDKKIDEDFTQRMKDNIEVINSIELDSTSQKVTD